MRRWLLGLGAVGVLVALVLLVVLGRPGGREGPEHGPTSADRPDPPGPACATTPEEGVEKADAILHGRAHPGGRESPSGVGVSSLAGQVVDAATGAGIEGAVVIAFASDGRDLGPTAESAEGGRFELTGLVPGRWWLFVWHPLFVSVGLDERLRGEDPEGACDAAVVLVPEGGGPLPARVLALSPGRRIEGRVVDSEERPVADARLRLEEGAWSVVLAQRLGMSLRTWRHSVPLTADEEGRFVVACLPPSLPAIRIGATKKGRVGRWSRAIALDADLPGVTLILETLPTARVSGRVLEADGTPARPVEVSVSWDCEESWALDWARDPVEAVTVDQTGSWALTDLPPGPVALRASRLEPWLPGRGITLEPLAPGEVRRGVELTLPALHVLRGRLVSEEAAPLPGENLVVQERVAEADVEPLFRENVRTDGAGRFAVSTTVAGPLEILHLHPTKAARVLRSGVVLPVEVLTLVSQAVARTRIEVRVHDPEGRLVPRFLSRVICTRPPEVDRIGGPFESSVRGVDGVAVHLAPGTGAFRIRVNRAQDAEGNLLPLGTARLLVEAPPPDGTVDVTLTPPDEICGRIVGPDGAPVPGVRLALVRDEVGEERLVAPIPVRPDGTYSLRTGEQVQAWALRLAIEVPPGWRAVRNVSPSRGGGMGTIVLERGGSIAGRVIAPRGFPPDSEGELWAVWVGWDTPAGSYGGGLKAALDEKGRWRSENVPLDRDLRVGVDPGLAVRAGYQAFERVQGVRAGDPDVEIRLVPGLTISGTVRDAEGNPPASDDLRVGAHPLDGESRWCGAGSVSKEDGGFAVTGLAPGAYRVGLFDGTNGIFLGEHEAAAGEQDVRLRLPRRGSLRVRVGGPEAEFGCTVEIWVAGTTTRRASMYHGARPSFDLRGVPTDEPLIVVARSPLGHVAAAGGVRTGDTVTLELVQGLPLGGELRRRTRDVSPFLGRLYALRTGACFELSLPDDGEFYAERGVLAGRYELRYVAVDGTETVVARDVEAGQEDLEIWMP